MRSQQQLYQLPKVVGCYDVITKLKTKHMKGTECKFYGMNKIKCETLWLSLDLSKWYDSKYF